MNYLEFANESAYAEKREIRRNYLVGGSSSAWDRDEVEVIQDSCQFFEHDVDELDDCQIFFEGAGDSDQTEFWV